MKQGWFKRNFGWIGDDFRRLVDILRQPDMWVFIVIAAIFAAIVYFGFVYSLKLDFTMRLRRLTMVACEEMGNSATAFLFVAMIFLGLTITMVFGEFAHYLDYKRRKAYLPARSAAFQCLGWGAFALFIGLAMVLFLHSRCI